ncbi:MAG: KH domain-containing protein [Candidatus Edwardsbacteria bacterium]|nr:KH domain-containing protein [Candidatus Edwardsbacteria bacterium]MBU1577322.1 KH domain-containing protein [Candidatus Edwardsbacteria bacterium]MBU2464295.1 KH domain-containing protein [Candidatus Edwardsbacteria bacterium]MBU2594923.1 KH domain-containing protein [Candidatus Edwardsbacteria bacterium]
MLKDLVEFLSKSLVDQPEKVSVSEVTKNSVTVFELRVAKEDIGKVIGKKGRTAQSLRTLLAAAGTKLGKRTSLEIIE